MSLLFVEVDKNPGSLQAMIWQVMSALPVQSRGGYRMSPKSQVGHYSLVEKGIFVC
jgi:hypothetical protein